MMLHIEHEARFRSARRGRGRGAFAPEPETPEAPAEDAAGWVAGRLPEVWFTGPADVTVDREEILVVGPLSPPDAEGAAAAAGRIARFREETREQRMEIAREAQARFGRVVSWGARVGETTELFTTASVPVMTRLRQPERRVLDTLVEAGVARSRSDALAWCVRLVGRNQEDWIASLREALTAVEEARSQGPEV
ncbi:MAG TPA: hypothetical protein VNA20_15395 [Frankiaceae bacterium]|nr:hypothetical protein [Frankiaceae bacterium]